MQAMNAERWEQVQLTFTKAVELSGESRRQWVEEHCGRDTDLADSVYALLAEDAERHPLLDGDLENKVAEGDQAGRGEAAGFWHRQADHT